MKRAPGGSMSREPLTLIPALDGLRAIACVFVVLSHIPKYMSGATDIFRFKMHLGEPGVAIFFVLSGFLMSYLYIHKTATKERLVSYAIARFSRIAPAYWIAIIASYITLDQAAAATSLSEFPRTTKTKSDAG